MARSDLLRSHDELRAALVVAGKEIRKLNFGKRDSDWRGSASTVRQ